MNQVKPVILVAPLFSGNYQELYMEKNYISVLQAHGAIPFIVPFGTDDEGLSALLDMAQGVLLTGGQDLHPNLYGQPKKDSCQTPVPERDTLDSRLFTLAYKKDKAILGICRGLQIINAMLGGTLHQDLTENGYTEICHSKGATSPVLAKHTVVVTEESSLLPFAVGDRFSVNSFHHQGIDGLAPSLSPIVRAEDGLIEAVCDRNKSFLYGVQWHPERDCIDNHANDHIFHAFVEAASRAR